MSDDPLGALVVKEGDDLPVRTIAPTRPKGRPRGSWKRETVRDVAREAFAKTLYIHFSKAERTWEQQAPIEREGWREQAEDVLATYYAERGTAP